MKILPVLIVSFVFGILWFSNSEDIVISENSRVDSLLVEFGESPQIHFISDLDSSKVRMGKELVLNGKTKGPNGKTTKVQSKYFRCTDCHNVVAEDEDLANPDPDSRLKYAVKNGLPFLQGTTLYGVVNREHWYNDDYAKKYGSLVAPARDTLVNAVQLCATTCSQGREFSDWELDAVMHYLHSIGLKSSDLDNSKSDLEGIISSKNASDLKAKYASVSHATFLSPEKMVDRKKGANGNAENGKLIYDNSCLHCHKDGGVTNFVLSHEKNDFKYLKGSMGGNTHGSIYYISRKGTYAYNGYHPYMPNYTLERMSHQQLEDLAAYINQEATK